MHHDIMNLGEYRRSAFLPEDSAGIPSRDTSEASTDGRTNAQAIQPSLNPFQNNVDTSNVQQHTRSTQQQISYLSSLLFRRPENILENTTTIDTWQQAGLFPSDERKARLGLFHSSRLEEHRPNQQQQQQRDQLDERESLSSFSTPIFQNQGDHRSQLNRERISLNDVVDSADQEPRPDMGYTNTIQSEHWGHRMSMKMDSTFQSNSERKDRDEDAHSAASTASATTTSPSLLPLYADHVEPGGRHNTAAIGTPSTVSTAFSTDDVSVDGTEDYPTMERLSLKMDDSLLGAAPLLYPRASGVMSTLRSGNIGTVASHDGAIPHSPVHGRNLSWDDGASTNHTFQLVHSMPQRNQWTRESPNHSPNFGPARSPHGNEAWGNSSIQQARVASFRAEGPVDAYGRSQVPHTEAWSQQRRFGEQQPFMGHGHAIQQHDSQMYRQQGSYPPPRGKAQYSPHAQVASMTPPRARPRPAVQPLHRPAGASPLHTSTGPQGGTNPPRSSSEILKTLLRKKACLYEPDTSRAVALVTWLVGRELALAHGYFSRQQLQSGVHACVADKIDSGTITRTKVNRCMQIILNSCFHYIIPRPDGSEENGESFISVFGEGARDSSELLKTLPAPWNDITVDTETVLTASEFEEETEKKGPGPHSPQASPRFGPMDGKHGDVDGEGKRAVLLCFNENVRSAEDVFRCHNEFIRDTANASKLQLTAHEWRAFFGKDAVDTPMMWGGSEVSSKIPDGTTKRYDQLGRMNQHESQKFRTTWCAKRYDHDHSLCGFAHVEINGGWLRRDPSEYSYDHELCKSLITVGDKRPGHKGFVINECEEGVRCTHCHSKEEMLYHPEHYKIKLCIAAGPQGHGCAFGDVCPYFHPSDSVLHHAKKHPDNRHQRHRNSSHHLHGNSSQGKSLANMVPDGSPMLYVHPSPVSSFEMHLGMPGLLNLFRRHGSVVLAHLRTPIPKCHYSPFGDDWGIGESLKMDATASTKGLPPKQCI
jgi:hypothetical protein